MANHDTDARHLGALIVTHEKQRRRAMDDVIPISVRNAVKIIKANSPEAFGDYKKSVHAEGNEVVVDAPYAVAVEVGAAPHVAPLPPILAWAAKVGGDRELAIGTWKKIAREGMRPRWIVRSSIPKIMTMTNASVRYVLKK